MSSLHVEVGGSGPDLVLLHGWSLNLRVWDDVARRLRQRFRVIAIDLPGHGRSPWNAVRGTPAEQAWLVHEAVAPISSRYALLGWSLGGQIALDLAAALPGQVERLILVATTPKFAAGPDWPYGMPLAVLTRLTEQLRTDYQRTVREFLELQVRGSTGGEQVLEQLREALFVHGEAQPAALAAGLDILTASDLRPILPHVQAPALVMAGQYDRITSPNASRALAEGLPDARYLEFRRAAHAPFLSHLQDFATEIESFLLPASTTAAPVTNLTSVVADAPAGSNTPRASDRSRTPAKRRASAKTRASIKSRKSTVPHTSAKARASSKSHTAVKSRVSTRSRASIRSHAPATPRVPTKARTSARPHTLATKRKSAKARALVKSRKSTVPRVSTKARAPAKQRASARTLISTKSRASVKARAPAKSPASATPRARIKPRASTRSRSSAKRRVPTGSRARVKPRTSTKPRASSKRGARSSLRKHK